MRISGDDTVIGERDEMLRPRDISNFDTNFKTPTLGESIARRSLAGRDFVVVDDERMLFDELLCAVRARGLVAAFTCECADRRSRDVFIRRLTDSETHSSLQYVCPSGDSLIFICRDCRKWHDIRDMVLDFPLWCLNSCRRGDRLEISVQTVPVLDLDSPIGAGFEQRTSMTLRYNSQLSSVASRIDLGRTPPEQVEERIRCAFLTAEEATGYTPYPRSSLTQATIEACQLAWRSNFDALLMQQLAE